MPNVAGRMRSRRSVSAWLDTESVPPPASGTDTTRTCPWPSSAVLIGSRMGPPAAARDSRAASTCRTGALVSDPPVTTTSAGAGPPGKACSMARSVRTTGISAGRLCRPGLSTRIPSAGALRATIAMAAVPPHTTGLATTRRTSARQNTDRWARTRRRPRKGTLPRSTRGPSQASRAGRAVSEPSTAMPTTVIVPMARPEKTSMPVAKSPPSEIITVSPDTTIARPEVAAATASASRCVLPAARSSRSRRR